MIRSYFGLTQDPFALRDIELLSHQQEIHDTLRVHSQQGGLCLVVGRPGTGKSVIKESLRGLPDKDYLVATIARTLHTYTNTVKILCEAFKIEFESSRVQMRTQTDPASLQSQSQRQDARHGDRRCASDGHGKPSQAAAAVGGFSQEPQLDSGRPSRIAVEPGSGGQPRHQEPRDVLGHHQRLHDDAMREFIERQLDRIGLAHNTFTAGATELIIRTADGVLRRCRNLCLASMLEAVRASAGTTIDIDLVNRVLLQPHWQKEVDLTDF